MMIFNAFDSRDQVVESLCDALIESIQKNINEKQACSLAVAGGNTPKPLYERLSKQTIAWDKVNLTLTDERWVEPSDVSSNQNMVWHSLIQNQASEVNFIPLKNPHMTALAGEDECGAILKQSIPMLDVVVLGMGEDGHFASIFPGLEDTQKLLDVNSQEICSAVQPEGREARMSLTLSYILKAKYTYLFITGEEKKRIIDNIVEKNRVDVQYPVSALLLQNTCPVQIYWSS